MKKILIISYFYPPRPGIGSERTYRISKYLPRFNWSPVILTAKLPDKPSSGIKVIESDYTDVLSRLKSRLGLNSDEGFQKQLGIVGEELSKKTNWKDNVITFSKELIAYPDEQKGWYSYALQSACEYLDREKVDIILSSSYPVTAHLVASKLGRMYRIPWLADLRDLWTQNHFWKKHAAIRYFEKKLELETLSEAEALVTVTERFAEDLRKLHKNKQVYCVTNGYDADDYQIKPTKFNSKLTITYTGILYNGKRNPSMLFDAVKQLLDEESMKAEMLEVNFYSEIDEWLNQLIDQYDLGNIIKLRGKISRDQVIEKQRESNLLLLILDNNNAEEDVYPAKVFEYFAAKKPIIAFGGSGGILKELLQRTETGLFFDSVDDMKKCILQYFNEFIKTGELKCGANETVSNYNYLNISKTYAEILDGLIDK